MTLKRILPAAALLILVSVIFAAGLDRYLTFDALRDNRAALLDFVGQHWFIAALAFVVAYATVAAISLPGATIMTLTGGFLFGVAIGSGLTVVGATLGATAIFLTARTALGDALRRKAGPFLARTADGFNKDAFNYLLFLRLVPVFPFWVVNLVPALFGMRLVPFVVATGVGIIPGTIVYTAFGAGLGSVFDTGRAVDLGTVLNPTMVAACIGLGLLALLPIAAKRMRERRS